MSASVLCHGCGQSLEIPADYTRSKMRCPECGVMCEVPPSESRPAPKKQAARRSSPPTKKPAAPPPPPPEPEVALDDLPIPLTPAEELPPPMPHLELDEPDDDEDDGKPYGVSERLKNECPQCGMIVSPDDEQCPGCGREFKKKPKKVFKPADRSWEAGWPLDKRRMLFYIAMILSTIAAVAVVLGAESWGAAITAWLTSAVLVSFLLGTYPRVNLSRTKRGKVTLTKTWRVCFFERAPDSFDVREFEGVRTGYASDVDFFDWVIALMLLPAAGIGILWWLYFIHRDQHTVTLVREHGYGSDVLYRGVSEDMAHDMAYALEEIGGLPYENPS
jgi:hypothetical protein